MLVQIMMLVLSTLLTCPVHPPTSLQTTYVNDHTVVTLTLISYYFQKIFLKIRKKNFIIKKVKENNFKEYFEIFCFKNALATSILIKLFVKKLKFFLKRIFKEMFFVKEIKECVRKYNNIV